MSRTRQRDAVLQAVGMKMLEEGKLLDKRQYDRCTNTPIRSAEILRHFSSWTRMLNLLKADQPKIWEELEKKQGKTDDPLSKLAASRSSKAAVSSKEMLNEG